MDDRKSDRETIKRVLVSMIKKLNLSDSWTVVAEEPPSNARDVVAWLDENDATVLVTDWKLNEGARSERVVDYEADRLIREVRKKRPTFPIFVITGYQEAAKAHLGDVEGVWGRSAFAHGAGSIVPQMLRAGRRRYDEQRQLLGSMDSLSRKVAGGKASRRDRRELGNLQGYFQADLPGLLALDGVLSEFEMVKERAAKLRKRVEKRLRTAKER